MRILSALSVKFLARRRAGKEIKDFLYSMEEMEESYSAAMQKMPDSASSIACGSSRTGSKMRLRSLEHRSSESTPEMYSDLLAERR